ncbi:HAD family hydrolase [Pseudophaeobacter arcticus]|uniref:HAD family hydrolase n=1 Tax=Pseudophaeobacter arcticus TaxID=385492 RepID=UPI0003F8D6BC|nr:HAD family phosphatase [Pseudophaeobacter arcticus]
MPTTFPTPQLVIFDCDGVLVDSERVSNQALVDNLAGHGLELSLERSMQLFVGGTMTSVMQKAISLGADLHDGWIDEIYAETYVALKTGVDLTPGVTALLAVLDHHQIPCCVASNGSEDKMRITLGQNGLWQRFHPTAMFSAHSLGVAKPDPGLFLAAASHFGIQARDCLVVEDSATGAIAAARAGMRCLGFAPVGGGAGLTAAGAEVFHLMSDIPALIGL